LPDGPNTLVCRTFALDGNTTGIVSTGLLLKVRHKLAYGIIFVYLLEQWG